MNILQEVYASMTDEQRAEVFNWAKEQVLQNNFSCTMKPLSGPKLSKKFYVWLETKFSNKILFQIWKHLHNLITFLSTSFPAMYIDLRYMEELNFLK